jgi:multidrug efflux pump
MKLWDHLLAHPILVGLGASALGLFGLVALLSLPLRPDPPLPPQYVDVNIVYPGASASTVQRFVALPMESAFASLAGVSYVSGSASPGAADVQAHLGAGAAPDTVFAELLAAASAARSNMPAEVQAPQLTLVGDENANQELTLIATIPHGVSEAAVTDFVNAQIVPRLQTIRQIGPVTMYEDNPALRVSMDPARMMVLGVSPSDVANAAQAAATITPAGTLQAGGNAISVEAGSELADASAFGAVPVATRKGVPVLLSSVGSAVIGPPVAKYENWFNGKRVVFFVAGIAPGGNVIQVARAMQTMLDSLKPQLPPGLALRIVYNEATSVNESLRDLALTLAITIFLVSLIVRLSLGSARAALAPVLAILLSLLGAALVMQLAGQSLNLFTIIALVLAVGLVVDDAIVVSEDIIRRVQMGEAPLVAASASITRLAPVLAAISSTLVVAFLPLAFLDGVTASLFRPFALVLIASFLWSLLIALTVVPHVALWDAKRQHISDGRNVIDRVRARYVGWLSGALRHTRAIGIAVIGVAVVCVLLFRIAPQNLTPQADGIDIDVNAFGPHSASLGYLVRQAHLIEQDMRKIVPGVAVWQYASQDDHAVYGGMEFASPALAAEAVTKLSGPLGALPGMSAYVSQENGMPGLEDMPVDVLLAGQVSYLDLLALADRLKSAGEASGQFSFLDVKPRPPAPEYDITIDRRAASDLGIPEADIKADISAALAGGIVGQVDLQHATFNVIANAPRTIDPAMIKALPLRIPGGAMVPLGSVINIRALPVPNEIRSWQGLPSVIIQGEPAPGVALGDALHTLDRAFHQLGQKKISFGLEGLSATFQQTQSQNIKLFALGLAGLFFLLAAQFRSLRDPFVVITTVPLASLGPLALIMAGGATLNIVTEIALLAVWGLIARQGILFVQVAHEGRAQNLPIIEAAKRAASLRFRPILMITLALIGGAVPLMFASGPQAVIRYDLGVILATGMGSGFLLSLFAVPAMYCILHGRRDAH